MGSKNTNYGNLLAIFDAVKELGGQQAREAIHDRIDAYVHIQSTTHKLRQLSRLGLLNQQSTGKDFVYSLSSRGKNILALPKAERVEAMKRTSTHANTPKECRFCKRTVGIMWFRDGYYCEKHLNSPLERPTPQTFVASSMSFI